MATEALPSDQQQNYEAQFADLMGDLGDKPAQNGEIANGDVTMTTTVTETGPDGAQVTTTTTTVTKETEAQKDGTQVQESDASAEVLSRNAPHFEDTLADYQPPKRMEKKNDGRDAKGPNVFITNSSESDKKPAKTLKFLGGGADNRCKKCDKRVYEMEKIIADKSIFHKSCFRCAHCNRVLTLGNFAGIDDQTYCKPHFIELFKKKGKYDMAKQTQQNQSQSRAPRTEENTDRDQESVNAGERTNGVSNVVAEEQITAQAER